MEEAFERGIEGRRVVVDARRALASAWRAALARKCEVVCAALLLLMAANLFAQVARKSITNDEIVHIPAGYYHLVEGEYQLNNEHPPLIKMWGALPLLFVQPEEPLAPAGNTQENSGERMWGFHSRFWQANRARFDSVTFWPRVLMIPLTIALGVVIFIYARKFFGARAAVLAVALYSFEPTFLAHGRIVHTDVPAALVYTLFFLALYRYAESSTHGRVLQLSLVTAFALLTKFSMVVLLPMLVVCLAVRLWRERREGTGHRRTLIHAGTAALVVLLTVNAAYRFERPPLEASDVRWVATKSAPHFEEITGGIRVLSTLVPTYYLYGFYNVFIHNQYGHSTSLLGEGNDLGWWYYFPTAFALKTTLPILITSVIALAWLLWRALSGRARNGALAVLIPLAIYAALSMTSHINIGVRHFLPAYPFILIASGALLDRLLSLRVRAAGLAVVAAVLCWAGVEAARAYPDYTSYMNQLANARPRWWYLSDSNVEWGDEVVELADYLKARGETRVRATLSGGWTTLSLYGVEYISLHTEPGEQLPETRYTAIGASFLNGSTVNGGGPGTGRDTDEARRNFFAAYRTRQPEAVFGNSIYLYRERE